MKMATTKNIKNDQDQDRKITGTIMNFMKKTKMLQAYLPRLKQIKVEISIAQGTIRGEGETTKVRRIARTIEYIPQATISSF